MDQPAGLRGRLIRPFHTLALGIYDHLQYARDMVRNLAEIGVLENM